MYSKFIPKTRKKFKGNYEETNNITEDTLTDHCILTFINSLMLPSFIHLFLYHYKLYCKVTNCWGEKRVEGRLASLNLLHNVKRLHIHSWSKVEQLSNNDCGIPICWLFFQNPFFQLLPQICMYVQHSHIKGIAIKWWILCHKGSCW